MTREWQLTQIDHHASERLLRPQDIDGSLAVVDTGNWAVTLQHIDNDRGRPSKRTTVMWAGRDWSHPGDGFEPGGIRRRAVVGPLVENTSRPPFYCMTLDEIRIDGVRADGAIWGHVTSSSGVRYEDAGANPAAGRDAALNTALHFCSHSFGADGYSSPTSPIKAPTDSQRPSNFALANQVMALAFRVSSAKRVKDRSIELFTIRANLAEALFRPDFEKRGERVALKVSGTADADSLDEFGLMIGNLPLVTTVDQRDHFSTLSATFKRAGLGTLSANSHLSVDVSTSDDRHPAHAAEDVLAAAGTRKCIDSGWLCPTRQAPVPRGQKDSE